MGSIGRREKSEKNDGNTHYFARTLASFPLCLSSFCALSHFSVCLTLASHWHTISSAFFILHYVTLHFLHYFFPQLPRKDCSLARPFWDFFKIILFKIFKNKFLWNIFFLKLFLRIFEHIFLLIFENFSFQNFFKIIIFLNISRVFCY